MLFIETSTFLFIGHVSDPRMNAFEKNPRNLRNMTEDDYFALGFQEGAGLQFFEENPAENRCCKGRCAVM